MPRSGRLPLWPFAAAIVLGFGIAAGGCTDYLHHRETITVHTGDAPAANIAIHAIDPWPPYVRDANIRHSGKRTRHVIERYNAGPEEGKKVGPQQIILTPVGAPAAN